MMLLLAYPADESSRRLKLASLSAWMIQFLVLIASGGSIFQRVSSQGAYRHDILVLVHFALKTVHWQIAQNPRFT
ncbi:hypothetical protein K431DRAFT_285555 [Polychaeton citri CBS 116435]|uniref:Uncharacterized protein n=1 Tax=Polychaeton citri CBS 116435 TaxID=1314669 RepID=A0A9P4Q7E4_9PEZI|nr:hypothetical protein K431DRAFT_285555 [Polychaeton citri CBS 116435]